MGVAYPPEPMVAPTIAMVATDMTRALDVFDAREIADRDTVDALRELRSHIDEFLGQVEYLLE